MKKVLILAPKDSSFRKPLLKAFGKLGWEIKEFDYRKGDIFIRIFRFLPVIGGFEKAQKKVGGKIVAISKQFNPNLILTTKGESLDKETISKLKNKKAKIVNWFPDPMNLWELMNKIAPYYDIFFHFDPLIVRELKKSGHKNIKYLPFASEIQAITDFRKEYDISFVGTYSKDREKKLSCLTEFDLNIWGDPKWFNSSLKRFVRGGRIHQNEMKKIIKKTLININIHYNAPREGANLRTFETTGCGGFLLTDYVRDLDNLFKIDRDIVCYSSLGEMKSKVRFYLKQQKRRDKIAYCGYQRSRKDHNYLKRIKQLLMQI